MGKWVKCEERMPEHHVIVWGFWPELPPEQQVRHMHHGNQGWYLNNHLQQSWHKPTHWWCDGPDGPPEPPVEEPAKPDDDACPVCGDLGWKLYGHNIWGSRAVSCLRCGVVRVVPSPKPVEHHPDDPDWNDGDH